MICRFCKSIAIVRLSDKYTKCLTCGAVNSAKVDKIELDELDNLKEGDDAKTEK